MTLNGCKRNVETTLNLACILGEDILSLFKMARIDKQTPCWPSCAAMSNVLHCLLTFMCGDENHVSVTSVCFTLLVHLQMLLVEAADR